MDYFTATVVSIRSERIIVQKQDCEEFFDLPIDAKNCEENAPELYLTADIEVHETINVVCAVPNEFEPKCSGTVRSYSFNKTPKLVAQKGKKAREHVVSVVEIGESHVGVVGPARARKIVANTSKDMESYSFAIGSMISMKPFFSFAMKGSNLWVTKDTIKEREYDIMKKQADLGNIPMPEQPSGGVTFYNLRPLTEEETSLVNTKCSELKEITLEETLTFIQDPMLSAMNAQVYAKQAQLRNLQLNAYIDLLVNEESCEIKAEVHIDVIRQLTDLKIQDSWRMGNELAMRNTEVLKNSHIALIYDSFTLNLENKNFATVKFLVSPRSNLVARMLFARGFDDGTPFTIGPFEDENQSAHDVVMDEFPAFFARKELFDVWRGAKKQAICEEIPNRAVPFFVDGKQLDNTQLEAMRMAAGVEGFTCISAPPGSGKTFMISALVKSLEEQYEAEKTAGAEPIKPRIAISATTNIAVTNAVESIHRHYPDMKVCREFSVRAEEELDVEQPENEISLKHMIESGEYDDQLQLDDYWKAFNEKEKVLNEIRENIQNISVGKGIQRLQYLRKMELEVARLFVRAYEPTVFGTTAELMSRSAGSQFTHLIIDEASQMSPFSALALYCSLPTVTHVTLLGDSKQLGPHLILPPSSQIYQYQMRGELTRLTQMQVCPHHQLKTVYRCHPMLLDIWLKPIYGDLLCGATHEQRDYCTRYDLLKSKVHAAPTLMVHVPTVTGSLGRNPREVALVIRFLEYLKKRNVPNEDITLLCHHRAQKEEIIKKLRDQGNIGRLGLLHAVHTVDSFQGKEAKIVIVLTTKTTKADDYDSIVRALSFVSDESRETVAISRASHGLYIFGDWSKLGRTPFWRQFGSTLMKYGAVVDGKFDRIFNPSWFTMDDPKPVSEQENGTSQSNPRVNLQKEFERSHVDRYRNQRPNVPATRPPVYTGPTSAAFDFTRPPPPYAIPQPRFDVPAPSTFELPPPAYTPTVQPVPAPQNWTVQSSNLADEAQSSRNIPPFISYGSSVLPSEQALKKIWAPQALASLSAVPPVQEPVVPAAAETTVKPTSPGFLSGTRQIEAAQLEKMFNSLDLDDEPVKENIAAQVAPVDTQAVYNFDQWSEAVEFAKKTTGQND